MGDCLMKLIILETNPKIWFFKRNGVYLVSRIFRIEFVPGTR